MKMKSSFNLMALTALIGAMNHRLYATNLSPIQKLLEDLIVKPVDSITKPVKSWIFGTEYTGNITISHCRFSCTTIQPYDSNRGYIVTEIKKIANTDSRGALFYNTLTTKTTYSNDRKIIQFEESKSTDPFPLYIENYIYDCQSSYNNSTEIKSSTGCTAVMTVAGPSLKSTEKPAYRFDLQASAKTVPKGCITEKEYTEWTEKPEYIKTQTITLESIINTPLTISARFTPDLNQEIANNVSYRWVKIR
jgi:hypothetical protein